MARHGEQDLLVDLALDSPPTQPSRDSVAGPTFAPAELAARKLLALFDRAAARDFADVFVLAGRFGADSIFTDARALDSGLTAGYLAEQLETLRRFSDADIPAAAEDVPLVRAFFATWSKQLRRDEDGEHSAGCFEAGAPPSAQPLDHRVPGDDDPLVVVGHELGITQLDAHLG